MTISRFLRYTVHPEAGDVIGPSGNTIRRVCGGGYIQAHNSKTRFNMQAHLIVWQSVHGPIPTGMQINHINGIKSDNRIANLELVTAQENSAHAYRTGLTSAVGEKNGRAILRESDVRKIRSSVLSQQALATEYRVSRATIRDVINGKNWSHVA
jgi:hypothetical protein